MTDQNQTPTDNVQDAPFGSLHAPISSQGVQKTIIEELGLGDLPQEKQEALLSKMTEVVLQRIFVETMEKLASGDQEAMEKMIDSGAEPEELEKFMKEKIPDYDGVVKKIIDDFREEMKREI